MIDFGREVCGLLPASERREWLVTNGIGGYASGTVAGLPTRRYHGLLVAALKPPVGRKLLVTKVDESATYDGREYPLYTTRWRMGEAQPRGYANIERFHLEGTIPTWTFACADALLIKRVWMQTGVNTTYVSYHLERGSLPLTLAIKPMVNYRDADKTTRSGALPLQVDKVEKGLRISTEGSAPFYVLTDRASFTGESEWYPPNQLAIEAERGADDIDDANVRAGRFEITLKAGESFCLIATTDVNPDFHYQKMYQTRVQDERDLVERAALGTLPTPALQSAVEQLVLGANQFIVRRGTGHTVIAGYPWFADWGRDTMIALQGLALATRRYVIAASILRTFAQFESDGMLPNRFPEAGEDPEYNTVDATLWYVEAVRAYYAATNDKSLLRDLMPTLRAIINWHTRGTRYNIRVQEDGLLYSGAKDVQLTWMDVKIGDWVVTPRTGKAVEINALWYNALRSMALFSEVLGTDGRRYSDQADLAEAGFAKFWNSEKGCCYDVLDTPEGGHDASLRPNQLIAVSLPHSALSADQQHAVVDVCARQLVTSHGLRSLAPDHENYAGRYKGNHKQRDAVYHQGTTWGWLIGPFVSAHLRVYQDKEAARRYLMPLIQHSQEHSLGTVAEIFDGDAPHTPNGCWAQAWSVAEVLRALRETL